MYHHMSNAKTIAIGNFDGCHLGHQALISEAIALSEVTKTAPSVLTFDPRPDVYFSGDPSTVSLFTPDMKIRALQELGIHQVITQLFDANFAKLSPQEFFSGYLITKLKARGVAVGANFRFGHQRQGNSQLLSEFGRTYDVSVKIVAIDEFDKKRVSSTRIRESLALGEIEQTHAMLGHPYLIEGTIKPGQKLGRQLGFPTANLEDHAQLLPAHGVYAGYVCLQDTPSIMQLHPKVVPAVFNIGVRPSVTEDRITKLEAHLLTGEYGKESLYDVKSGFYLLRRLRPELKFPNLTELKNQIATDIQRAKLVLGCN